MSPIVEIEQGKLEGIQCSDNTFMFRGIPYAKPPVGELRFSDPLLPESWEGVRDATKRCNICAQKDMFQPDKYMGDEDCLYLNVYTPELPSQGASSRPVLVFIHGGGFAYGNGTDHEQVNVHGYFVDRGIVVVSINYRVGVLGFLALDLKGAPGNMGLKDQSLALKWVQKNISKFGGNPNNVTIYGISAGSASIEYQVVSPMSKGLFHRAIAQSGSSMSPWSQNNDVRELSRKIAAYNDKTFSNDEDLLKYLKEMPIEDLIKTSELVSAGEPKPGGVNFGFVPCTEKPNGWQAFLEESEYELLKKGQFSNVPFMTTYCTREGLIAARLAPQNVEKLMKEKNFGEFLQSFFHMDNATAAKYDAKCKEIYLSLNIFPEPDAFVIEFFSDLDFLAGIYLAAKLMSKHNPNVYLSEFVYEGNLPMIKKTLALDYKGTCHGDDWGYMVQGAEILAGIQPSKADELTTERLLSFYTNFIKHGKPTTEINDVITTHWEPVEPSNVKYLVLGKELKMESEPAQQRMRLFEELYEKYYGK